MGHARVLGGMRGEQRKGDSDWAGSWVLVGFGLGLYRE
jgi:hypothetical protein